MEDMSSDTLIAKVAWMETRREAREEMNSKEIFIVSS